MSVITKFHIGVNKNFFKKLPGISDPSSHARSVMVPTSKNFHPEKNFLNKGI